MSNKRYSKFDLIPKAMASNHIVKGCLVLEGGAFRGVYTEGFIDTLMMEDFNFEAVVGTSAGALNGLNYTSGQIGRGARANLGYRFDPQYIGIPAYQESGSPLNLDFLLKDFNAIEPLNQERYNSGLQRYVVTCTNCRTGKTHYFEKGKCQDMDQAIKASASMPFLSPMVKVEGIPCLDGGCSCKVPYQWAIDEGYEKIVVVRTRDRDFRKKIADYILEDLGDAQKPADLEGKRCKVSAATREFYKDYPKFAYAYERSNLAYNLQCQEMEELHEKGRIFMVNPSEPVTIGRLERDVEKLGDLYELGRKDAYDCINDLLAYLKDGDK